ncbi:30S ribosomal protein S9 [Candidatus Woesebacteria bacterium]|nr:30S ribosomal protein S9 [Candidatus Woesebacteria bacterium]
MAKNDKKIYYEAVGRRKASTARVRLYIPGKDKSATIATKKYKQGDIIVNEKPFSEYFPGERNQAKAVIPLTLTKSVGRFVISVRVVGGGKHGQLEAIMHGLSRALCLANEESRAVLKPKGLLTRDPRVRERRKVGTGGKARRQKQSPKR